MTRRIGGVLAFGSAAAIALGAPIPASAHGITERVSVGPGGVQGNVLSYGVAISAGGRFVAFQSNATTLVPGKTNRAYDVFVRDRLSGTTERVSLGPGGVQGDGDSYGAAISADGRFVAFSSEATNLAKGDTNGTTDVFVRDRQKGTTRRVSVGSSGVQGNGQSFAGSFSADGRFVAFDSYATNLVSDDTNGENDVFVHDRQTRKTRRASVGSGGVQGDWGGAVAAFSPDGRLIAFTSYSTNLVPGDTNGENDVFVRILAP